MRYTTEEKWRRELCTGTSEQIADDINGLAELGVEHLLLNLQRPSLDQTLEEMDRFNEEVRPLLET